MLWNVGYQLEGKSDWKIESRMWDADEVEEAIQFAQLQFQSINSVVEERFDQEESEESVQIEEKQREIHYYKKQSTAERIKEEIARENFHLRLYHGWS